MSYIIHNDLCSNEKIQDLIIKVDKLLKILEPMTDVKSEGLKPVNLFDFYGLKKPDPEIPKSVNLIELYGLKPLSFYSEQ
jgi:hypothetical protein